MKSVKTALVNRNSALVENENEFDDKFNDVVNQLEQEQETLAGLETQCVRLRAESQPLEYLKDNF